MLQLSQKRITACSNMPCEYFVYDVDGNSIILMHHLDFEMCGDLNSLPQKKKNQRTLALYFSPDDNLEKLIFRTGEIVDRPYKDGPAIVAFHPDGRPSALRYIENGEAHRDYVVGPAHIKLTENGDVESYLFCRRGIDTQISWDVSHIELSTKEAVSYGAVIGSPNGRLVFSIEDEGLFDLNSLKQFIAKKGRPAKLGLLRI